MLELRFASSREKARYLTVALARVFGAGFRALWPNAEGVDDHGRGEAGSFQSDFVWPNAEGVDDHGRGESDLTPSELELVETWASADATVYDKLRNPKTAEGKEFGKVLDKLPIYNGTAYRGMTLTNKQIAQLVKKDDATLGLHSSASQDSDVATQFMRQSAENSDADRRPVLLELRKSSARDIGSAIKDKDATHREVVVKADTPFRFKGLVHEQGYTRLIFEGFEAKTLGGEGSGNFGHAGRPGEVGGSSSEAGTTSEWFDGLKRVGAQKGSNPGGTYKDASGQKWYVKQYKNADQGFSEQVSNEVYKGLGLNVPTSVVGPEGQFATRWVEGTQTVGNAGLTAERADAILDGYAADVFVANWDAVGTGLDNAVLDKDGNIMRIDQGGTLLFRAQGGLKPEAGLHHVGEWKSLADPNMNVYYARVFKAAGIKGPDALGSRAVKQIERISALRPKAGWESFVRKAAPHASASYVKKVGVMLEARQKGLEAIAKNLTSRGLSAQEPHPFYGLSDKLRVHVVADASIAAVKRAFKTTIKGLDPQAKDFGEQLHKRLLAQLEPVLLRIIALSATAHALEIRQAEAFGLRTLWPDKDGNDDHGRGEAEDFEETKANAAAVKKAGIKVFAPSHLVDSANAAIALVLDEPAVASVLKAKGVEFKDLKGKYGTSAARVYVDASSLAKEGVGFAASILYHEAQHAILTERKVPTSQQEPRVLFNTRIWAGLKANKYAVSNPKLSLSFKRASDLSRTLESFRAAKKPTHTTFSTKFVKTTFDTKNPRAISWAKKHAGSLVEGLTKESVAAVRGLIASGIEKGRTVDKTAYLLEAVLGLTERQGQALVGLQEELELEGLSLEDIRDEVFARSQDMLEDRALSIARTETMRASNEGQMVLWEEAVAEGLLTGTELKEWIVTPDDRLCPICEELDGVAVGLSESFTVGEEEVSVPPAHPNCRCTIGISALREAMARTLGGKGSGNFGHAGQGNGEVGGSGPANAGFEKKGKNAPATKEQISKAWKLYQQKAKYAVISKETGLTEKQAATIIWKIKHKGDEHKAELDKVKAEAKAVAAKATSTGSPALALPSSSSVPDGYTWQEKNATNSPYMSAKNAGKWALFDASGTQVSAAVDKDKLTEAIKTLHNGLGPQPGGKIPVVAPKMKTQAPVASSKPAGAEPFSSVDTVLPSTTDSTPNWPITADVDRQVGNSYQGQVDSAYYNWAHSLSASEAKAIKSYTGSGYEELNSSLYKGKALSAALQLKADRLTAALQKAPVPPPPELVWRGIKYDGATSFLSKVAKSDVVQLDGFQSTSIDPQFAKSWSGSHASSVLLEIKPKLGAYVERITATHGEKEFILPHGSKYRVHGARVVTIYGKKTRVVQLEQLK